MNCSQGIYMIGTLLSAQGAHLFEKLTPESPSTYNRSLLRDTQAEGS